LFVERVPVRQQKIRLFCAVACDVLSAGLSAGANFLLSQQQDSIPWAILIVGRVLGALSLLTGITSVLNYCTSLSWHWLLEIHLWLSVINLSAGCSFVVCLVASVSFSVVEVTIVSMWAGIHLGLVLAMVSQLPETYTISPENSVPATAATNTTDVAAPHNANSLTQPLLANTLEEQASAPEPEPEQEQPEARLYPSLGIESDNCNNNSADIDHLREVIIAAK
jgi:hypothetical protein